jgi:predicted enzyme related to lactoylglutathione lyase
MATYLNGTPSWVDFGSPDIDASVAFYGDLFGWTATEPGPIEQTGGYRMFEKDGKLVAGIGPSQEGMPPVWTTYLAVDDADATTKKVEEASGAVFMAPFDVADAGRMAIFADPGGAVFGVWQAGTHTGAELVNQPGSLVWNELLTRDLDAARTFYAAAFGLEPAEFGTTDYTVLNAGGRAVAGVLPMGDQFPPEVPSNWVTYFAVGDADASAAKATSLGASVVREPFDIPDVGRIAWLAGPHGETFAVMKNTNPLQG